MLSQLVRNNSISTKNLKTKATKYSDTFKLARQQYTDNIDKLAKYTKLQIEEQNITENTDMNIVDNPNEIKVKLSDIYKEKEKNLPFFKSIQSQLRTIYG